MNNFFSVMSELTIGLEPDMKLLKHIDSHNRYIWEVDISFVMSHMETRCDTAVESEVQASGDISNTLEDLF